MAQQIESRRTDIRLGVIAAITNSKVPPYPTMAADRAFDSRQDPYALTAGDNALPGVTVYTDANRRVPSSGGQPPFINQLEIIIEMSLAAQGDKVETDAEMEAKLDIFEEQVLYALFGQDSPSAGPFRKMYGKVLSADSMRLANSDGNERLAMRDLILVIEYADRCWTLGRAFPEFSELRMCFNAEGEVIAKTIDDMCESTP